MISSIGNGLTFPGTGSANKLLREAGNGERPHNMPTKEEAHAAFIAEHALSPKDAFASDAELGPPSGTGLDDNKPENIHSEIKVNGKVVARVYNNGSVEIANEYGFLVEELDLSPGNKNGPDLAEERAEKVKGALERHGAIIDAESGAGGLFGSGVEKQSIELIRAETALTQLQWIDEMLAEGRPVAGSLFSTEV